MKSYKELQEKFNNYLELMSDWKTAEPENLYKPVEYIFSIGGKRLRPVLTLMTEEMLVGTTEQSLNAALAIEIFHNFTLLHDDIMDKSDMRRNKPTVHKKWNENIAILSGDLMQIKAYQLLTNYNGDILKKLLTVFNHAAIKVCEGQQFDMNFENTDKVSVAEYLKMIEYKTAALLAVALQLGAIVANANPNTIELLYKFGINLGMAFQLQDDYLDVFGDEKIFGKSIGDDIVSNKKTFLLINALEKAKNDDAKILHKLIKSKTFVRSEKIKAVTAIYEKLGIDEISKTTTLNYLEEAKANLKEIEVENAKKVELQAFIELLKERMY